MTTKDEALKQALDALKLGAAMYSPAGTAHAQIAAAIIACRAALAQKDEQDPVGEARAYESTTRYTHCIWDANVVPVGTKLYTAPPYRPPQKDERDSEEALRAIILRREAVIKVLERDAHEADQRASNAIGTRKVLWNLLGECSPLLHQLECDDAESEDRLNSLLQRIDDARSVVQAEELPGAVIAKATG